MFQESNNEQDIKQRMLDRMDNDISKVEGSFLQESVSPMALELEQSYMQLDKFLAFIFAETAAEAKGGDEYLTLRASEFGVDRKLGNKSEGKLLITGGAGTVIHAGTIVQTKGKLQFDITEDSVIESDGNVLVNIKAQEVGSQYNVPADTIVELPINVAGITSVTNPSATTGGTDRETNKELLERFLYKVRVPVTSGNKNHYKVWAEEVEGVGLAKVFPLWAGAGTVKVVIIDSNKQPANDTIRDNCYQHIEDVKPIGANVTVTSALGKVIDVSVNITHHQNYSWAEVEESISDNIYKYFQDIAFQQDYVSYGMIGSLIIGSEGVLDYSNLLINGASANIPIGDEEVAILGQVIVS